MDVDCLKVASESMACGNRYMKKAFIFEAASSLAESVGERCSVSHYVSNLARKPGNHRRNHRMELAYDHRHSAQS